MSLKLRLATALIYPLGDAIAQLILHEFSFYRVLSLTILALVFYQWEIPTWFQFLDSIEISNQKTTTIPMFHTVLHQDSKLNWLGRTVGAMIYFNPLWIARHMFFISLSRGNLESVGFNALILSSVILGTKSFLVNLPISILGNFIVQVKLKLEHRFLGSVILTSLLTICYAMAHRFL